jgi:hypothetical protein
MDKLSVSSVWQIKHTNNCNICKDCALEFSDLESYVSLHKIINVLLDLLKSCLTCFDKIGTSRSTELSPMNVDQTHSALQMRHTILIMLSNDILNCNKQLF